MNLLSAIANRLLNSIHLTPSVSVMLSFSPNLHKNKMDKLNSIQNFNNNNRNKNHSCNRILKSEPLSAVLPLYSWKFLAIKLFIYLYMIFYLPRALYTLDLMLNKDQLAGGGGGDDIDNGSSSGGGGGGGTSTDLGDLCDFQLKCHHHHHHHHHHEASLVKSGHTFSTFSSSLKTTSSSFSVISGDPSTAALCSHLLYDPVLTTHALKNSVSSYLLVIVSFGLMTLYSIYLDYMVFFRAVQWGPLFEEAALFHTGVPLLFNWRRPLASVKRVFRQAASLKRSPLAQENFSWGGFSGGPSKFFDRQTIGRGVALYQVLNVFFSGVLFFFGT